MKGEIEMISVSFVNNTIQPIKVNDSLIDIFNTVRESENSISLLVGDYISSVENNMLNEAVGLDVITEDAMEEKRKGVFEKIGEATMAVFKKIQDFIQKIVRAFKDLIYRLSPVEKKLDMVIKENPELANKVLAEIDSGNLSVMDLKNLNEVDKMYNDILEAAKRQEVDDKTLRGKFEKFKMKFDSFIDSNSSTVKRVQNVAAIITAATVIITAKSALDKARKTSLDAGEASAKYFTNFRKTVAEMEKTNYGDVLDPKVMTKLEICSMVNNYAQGNFSKIVKNTNSVSHTASVLMSKVLSLIGQDMNAQKFMDGIHELNDLDKTK